MFSNTKGYQDGEWSDEGVEPEICSEVKVLYDMCNVNRIKDISKLDVSYRALEATRRDVVGIYVYYINFLQRQLSNGSVETNKAKLQKELRMVEKIFKSCLPEVEEVLDDGNQYQFKGYEDFKETKVEFHEQQKKKLDAINIILEIYNKTEGRTSQCKLKLSFYEKIRLPIIRLKYAYKNKQNKWSIRGAVVAFIVGVVFGGYKAMNHSARFTKDFFQKPLHANIMILLCSLTFLVCVGKEVFYTGGSGMTFNEKLKRVNPADNESKRVNHAYDDNQVTRQDRVPGGGNNYK